MCNLNIQKLQQENEYLKLTIEKMNQKMIDIENRTVLQEEPAQNTEPTTKEGTTNNHDNEIANAA